MIVNLLLEYNKFTIIINKIIKIIIIIKLILLFSIYLSIPLKRINKINNKKQVRLYFYMYIYIYLYL